MGLYRRGCESARLWLTCAAQTYLTDLARPTFGNNSSIKPPLTGSISERKLIVFNGLSASGGTRAFLFRADKRIFRHKFRPEINPARRR
jgi:hypothetical protein